MATIVTAFAMSGVPATGLSPTIRIRRTDTQALVVTDAAMTEQGDGAYSYDFTTVDGLDYSIRADGGASLPGVSRYVFGSLSGSTEASLDAITEARLARLDYELVRIHTHLGLLIGTPVVHTPASIVAGSISTTIGVVGSTVTKETAS